MTIRVIDLGDEPETIEHDQSAMGHAFKQSMIDGDLTQAKAPCPNCGGTIYGHIAGRMKLLHARCFGTCGFEVLE